MTMGASIFTVRIKVYGLSLWMDRGTHYDVLFPDDRLSGDVHHFLSIEGGGIAGDALNRMSIDFRLLPLAKPKPSGLPIPGMLPLRVFKGSAALTEDIATIGTGLLGSLALPFGQLASLDSSLEGPYLYDGDSTLFLGEGVEWIGTCLGIPRVLTRQTAFSNPAQADTVELGAVDASTQSLVITIKCLSDFDRTHTDLEVKPGDILDEVASYDGLARVADSPSIHLPVYKGGTVLRSANFAASRTAAGLMAQPRKPCAAAYGVVEA